MRGWRRVDYGNRVISTCVVRREPLRHRQRFCLVSQLFDSFPSSDLAGRGKLPGSGGRVVVAQRRSKRMPSSFPILARGHTFDPTLACQTQTRQHAQEPHILTMGYAILSDTGAKREVLRG
eukprot:scaffold277100_cov43-Tisochrysis_lutea.AAC.1